MNDQRKTKKQLLEELEHQRELVLRERESSAALQDVSKRVAAAHDTDEMLDLIVNEAARLLGASWAHISLLKEGRIVPCVATEASAAFLDSLNPSYEVGERTTIGGHVMATKKPLVGEEGEQFISPESFRVYKEHGFNPGFANACVPLLANDRSIGVLHVSGKAIRRFTDDEVSLLTACLQQGYIGPRCPDKTTSLVHDQVQNFIRIINPGQLVGDLK